jgi:hypothetical protein
MARTPKTITFDEQTMQEIVRLRDEEGYKWDQVANAVELPPGKTMLIYSFAKTPKKLRIKEATGQDIANLRDNENLSWGVIMARTGYPEGSCRALYEEATGKATKGGRIGKGGRLPGESSGEPKAPRAPKAAKNPKPVAPVSKLEGMDDEAIKEFVAGRAIQVHTGTGDPEVIKVKSVTKVAKGKIVLVTLEGSARTIKSAAVIAVSKKKVA